MSDIDREQIRRDAEWHAAKHSYPEAYLGKTILALLAELEQAEKRADPDGLTMRLTARDARIRELEARLAKVPALVEALRATERAMTSEPTPPDGGRSHNNVVQQLRAALAEWEQT